MLLRRDAATVEATPQEEATYAQGGADLLLLAPWGQRATGDTREETRRRAREACTDAAARRLAARLLAHPSGDDGHLRADFLFVLAEASPEGGGMNAVSRSMRVTVLRCRRRDGHAVSQYSVPARTLANPIAR